MPDSPLDKALEEYNQDRSEVGMTLRDGSFVRGKVKDYDGYVVLIEGAPETMVYRHSILKLSRAAEMKASQAQPPARPQNRRRPPKAPAERLPAREAAEKQAPLSTMGEAMLKWLKSQKGGV